MNLYAFCNRGIRLLLISLSLTLTASAQTTAFTYQGNLSDGVNPANGNYDFQFKLFDALNGGTQQGTTQNITNVAVASGRFTVTLDFGSCASCFNGSPRFLEISVKPTGGGSLTLLDPRQPIATTPYAIRSQNSAAADGLSLACVNCVTSSQIQSVQGSQVTGNISGSQVSGAIPVTSVPAGSGNYIQNTISQQPLANFNIGGSGTLAGTLSANSVNVATDYSIAGNRVLSILGSRNIFAGAGAGNSNTSGVGNTLVGFSAGGFNLPARAMPSSEMALGSLTSPARATRTSVAVPVRVTPLVISTHSLVLVRARPILIVAIRFLVLKPAEPTHRAPAMLFLDTSQEGSTQHPATTRSLGLAAVSITRPAPAIPFLDIRPVRTIPFPAITHSTDTSPVQLTRQAPTMRILGL